MSSAAIDVRHLQVRLKGRSVLRDISFAVTEGEIFGILGPNGAGKSTTAECLAGFLPPDSGTVLVGGMSPHRHTERIAQILGYQLQSAQLPPMLRVREALELFASFYPAPQDVAELLRAVGLDECQSMPYGRLSGGQQQRLSIALALVGRPRIVVLDELTTGLDPEGRRDILDLIRRMREDGLSVVLITHYMEEAQRLCDRVTLMLDGRTFAAGAPADLVAAAQRQDPAVEDFAGAYLHLLDTQRRRVP